MKMVRIFAAPVVIALVACTSTTEEQQDRGLEGPGTSADTASDTNPYGAPYPTENIGTVSRGRGKPGQRIANFKFLGYPDGDTTELKPIALADFYDPEGRTYKLIHIQASGTWCTYCRQETEVVTPLAPKLKEKGVVWLMSLAEGRAVGTPSTQTDLDKWVANFNSPFTHLWDSGNKNLGIFYESAALPWNCTIDAKTMEILDAGVGAQGKLTPEQVMQYVDKMLGMAETSVQ
jgi:hypothetical protein